MTDLAQQVLTALNVLSGPGGSLGYPTAREIAAHLGENTSTVAGALRQLEAAQQARKVGEAFDGGRTWAPTSNTRNEEKP